MNQFDKVKFNNCVELFRTILKMNSQDVPQVKKAYLQHAINFEETLDFETQLDLLVLEGDSIKMSERVHRIVSTELNEVKQGQVIANLLIDHLFSDQTQLSKDVGLFIREFRLYDGKFRFRPTLSQNLQLSSLRNLLMELDIIEYDSSAKEYVLADHRVQLKLVNRPSRAFSKKEYVETLKMREQIGNLAEICILEYEKNRLISFPNLSRSIEHVAEKDVGAGYDIKSFEGPGGKETEKERRIEVKAVSLSSFRFHWSLNEMEKAEEYGPSYYLYLLPVASKNSFDVENIRIIQNPFKIVLKDPSKWDRICESKIFTEFDLTS